MFVKGYAAAFFVRRDDEHGFVSAELLCEGAGWGESCSIGGNALINGGIEEA